MPGEIQGAGMIASLIERVIDLFVNEDQLPEIRKRRQLRRLHDEARKALDRGDLVEYRRLSDELRVRADAP